MKKQLLALISLNLLFGSITASDTNTQYLSAQLRKFQTRNYHLQRQVAQLARKNNQLKNFIEYNNQQRAAYQAYQGQVLRDATLLAGTTGVITFCLGYFYLR
ncbi:MAG: septal ring factor EnvC (AmiA/AmiB activator) [Alteromonas naphthalenivorans]|jgi:septal ring factor EnvC (AmiA/AmiB activator)